MKWYMTLNVQYVKGKMYMYRLAPADYYKLPEHLQDDMEKYIEDGIRGGDFLTAVLSNDLKRAVWIADSENIKLLPDIITWLYNEVPQSCWGSKENVENWKGIDALW